MVQAQQQGGGQAGYRYDDGNSAMARAGYQTYDNALASDWDLGHWLRMISVSGWIGFTSPRGWKSKAHQVLRALGLGS